MNEINASLQKLLSRNEECDDDANMIPMCLPCYTKINDQSYFLFDKIFPFPNLLIS